MSSSFRVGNESLHFSSVCTNLENVKLKSASAWEDLPSYYDPFWKKETTSISKEAGVQAQSTQASTRSSVTSLWNVEAASQEEANVNRASSTCYESAWKKGTSSRGSSVVESQSIHSSARSSVTSVVKPRTIGLEEANTNRTLPTARVTAGPSNKTMDPTALFRSNSRKSVWKSLNSQENTVLQGSTSSNVVSAEQVSCEFSAVGGHLDNVQPKLESYWATLPGSYDPFGKTALPTSRSFDMMPSFNGASKVSSEALLSQSSSSSVKTVWTKKRDFEVPPSNQALPSREVTSRVESSQLPTTVMTLSARPIQTTQDKIVIRSFAHHADKNLPVNLLPQTYLQNLECSGHDCKDFTDYLYRRLVENRLALLQSQLTSTPHESLLRVLIRPVTEL